MKHKKIIILIGVSTLLIGLCISTYLIFSNKRELNNVSINNTNEKINNDVEVEKKNEEEKIENDPIKEEIPEETSKQEVLENNDNNKNGNSITTNNNKTNTSQNNNNNNNNNQTETKNIEKNPNTTNNSNSESSQNSSEKQENSNNLQEDKTTSTNQNKKMPWEELGLTEDEYYNKPMIKSQKVTHATMSECQAAGKEATKVTYDEEGNSHQDYSGFWCTDVLSPSGKYLGSMLTLF